MPSTSRARASSFASIPASCSTSVGHSIFTASRGTDGGDAPGSNNGPPASCVVTDAAPAPRSSPPAGARAAPRSPPPRPDRAAAPAAPRAPPPPPPAPRAAPPRPPPPRAAPATPRLARRDPSRQPPVALLQLRHRLRQLLHRRLQLLPLGLQRLEFILVHAILPPPCSASCSPRSSSP